MATFLIADDNEPNRLLLAQLVTYAGHEPVFASNGAEALTKLAEGVDVAVVDLHMPEGGGVEFIKALRRNGDDRLPVVLYTATPPGPMLDDFMAAYGVAFLISKPCEPADALNVIRAAADSLNA